MISLYSRRRRWKIGALCGFDKVVQRLAKERLRLPPAEIALERMPAQHTLGRNSPSPSLPPASSLHSRWARKSRGANQPGVTIDPPAALLLDGRFCANIRDRRLQFIINCIACRYVDV